MEHLPARAQHLIGHNSFIKCGWEVQSDFSLMERCLLETDVLSHLVDDTNVSQAQECAAHYQSLVGQRNVSWMYQCMTRYQGIASFIAKSTGSSPMCNIASANHTRGREWHADCWAWASVSGIVSSYKTDRSASGDLLYQGLSDDPGIGNVIQELL